MKLLDGLQEIFGKKIFRDDVQIDGSLIVKKTTKLTGVTTYYTPVLNEDGGVWHKILDPTTGWLASKTSGWTADDFSAGLTVDFSGTVPAGTKAVLIFFRHEGAAGSGFWRPSGDANISNTPVASAEYANQLSLLGASDNYDNGQAVIELSSDLKADFAVSSTSVDLYISYPKEYQL